MASAGALVVGTGNDLRNLAIARLAQTLNPALFIVLRQNEADNEILFRSFGAELVMTPSEIISDECVARLTSPLLLRFLRHVRRQTDAWADDVIHRLRQASGRRSPSTWELRLDPEHAPALCARDAPRAPEPRRVRLRDLLRDPDDRSTNGEAIALLALRDGHETLLPALDWVLAEGDEILFAGSERARRAVSIALHDAAVLEYLVTGREPRRHFWPRPRKESGARSP